MKGEDATLGSDQVRLRSVDHSGNQGAQSCPGVVDRCGKLILGYEKDFSAKVLDRQERFACDTQTGEEPVGDEVDRCAKVLRRHPPGRHACRGAIAAVGVAIPGQAKVKGEEPHGRGSAVGLDPGGIRPMLLGFLIEAAKNGSEIVLEFFLSSKNRAHALAHLRLGAV